MEEPKRLKPMFSFGLLTDVQYADIDNKPCFEGPIRYYRNSVSQVQKAVSHWMQQIEPISFVIQLGDIIDNHNIATNSGYRALRLILNEFDNLTVKTYHTIGNHELLNIPRTSIKKAIPFPTSEADDASTHNGYPSSRHDASDDSDHMDSLCCYTFSPHPGYRFVALDCYDVSVLGYSPEHPRYKEALKLIQSHNPNKEELNSWKNMVGVDQRYTKFNGGIGKSQLQWLSDVLDKALKQKEQVIVYGHIPLYIDAAQPFCLMFNFEEVMDLLHRYPNILCYLAGHDHNWRSAVDSHGIHHLTLPGIIQAPTSMEAFGTVHVYGDRLEVEGSGTLPNYTIPVVDPVKFLPSH